MRFEFDPESGAIYVRVRNGGIAETLEMAEPGFGAYLDIDREGNVLGAVKNQLPDLCGYTLTSRGRIV